VTLTLISGNTRAPPVNPLPSLVMNMVQNPLGTGCIMLETSPGIHHSAILSSHNDYSQTLALLGGGFHLRS